VAAQSRVDFEISKQTIKDIDDLGLAIAAGFNNKLIDKALNTAALHTAKAMVNPVKQAAVGARGGGTGRLRRAIWAKPVMRDKPGAYVGIRPGASRADTRGAYYRWIITSGVRNVPYLIKPKNAGALSIGGKARPFANRVASIPGNPFVSRTVEQNMDKVRQLFGNALASIIEKGIPKRGRVKITIPKPR
jgi:hypothetical protein